MDNSIFIGAVIFLCVFAIGMSMLCRKKSSSEPFEAEYVTGYKKPMVSAEMHENVTQSGLFTKNNKCEKGCGDQCLIDCKDVSNYELCYALCTNTCDGLCHIDVHYPPK